ncbi:MAG: hypothetical protein AW07_01879 [Candidatus Accumulibacter sp. SK-11]|nr:MAG: hypothetical protein AW07_01879 [Candidatus Accumulibacter sp. SK-11]
MPGIPESDLAIDQSQGGDRTRLRAVRIAAGRLDIDHHVAAAIMRTAQIDVRQLPPACDQLLLPGRQGFTGDPLGAEEARYPAHAQSW